MTTEKSLNKGSSTLLLNSSMALGYGFVYFFINLIILFKGIDLNSSISPIYYVAWLIAISNLALFFVSLKDLNSLENTSMFVLIFNFIFSMPFTLVAYEAFKYFDLDLSKQDSWAVLSILVFGIGLIYNYLLTFKNR